MEPAAFPTERAACRQSGGIQAQRWEGNIQRSLPGFDDQQTRSQGEKLTPGVAVRRRPIFRLAAVEGEGEHGHVALYQTAQFVQPISG